MLPIKKLSRCLLFVLGLGGVVAVASTHRHFPKAPLLSKKNKTHKAHKIGENHRVVAEQSMARKVKKAKADAQQRAFVIEPSFSYEQKGEIKKVVAGYLHKHPEVIVDAIYAARQKQMAVHTKHIEKTNQFIRQHANQIFHDTDDLVFGNKRGCVTLVEFLDYQCGHCKEMGRVVDALRLENPTLRFVLKEMPIFPGASHLAAKAVIAAYHESPKAGWNLHERLLKERAPLSEDRIWQLAKEAKLDVVKLKRVVKARGIADQLTRVEVLAKQIRLAGTPALIVGNRSGTKLFFVSGASSREHFQSLIDQAKIAEKLWGKGQCAS